MPDQPTNAERLIEARGLTKRYGKFAAVEDISFSVNRGQIVAFLGPNGAGKTTTMRLLTGYLTPTSGSARIAGFDVATQRLEAAARVGYLPENGPLYLDMTPDATLRFYGAARGLAPDRLEQRLQAVTKVCALQPVLHKPIRKLSKGYKQRVGLAQALLHEPDVLILDEPTTGLDPNQIRDVRASIREIGARCAILLSTHILQEVEAIADRVLFVHAGRLVFDGTVAEMKAHGDLDAFFRTKTGWEGKGSAEPEAVAAAEAEAGGAGGIA
jgi:ABC-2 type transport system ATP-binding protein